MFFEFMADRVRRSRSLLNGLQRKLLKWFGNVPTKGDNTHTHTRWLTKAFGSIWVVDDSVVFLLLSYYI